MVETNFTLDCKVMPFIDEHIRVISHLTFKPGSMNITGKQTIRPEGLFNETQLIKDDVPYIIIKNQNNY